MNHNLLITRLSTTDVLALKKALMIAMSDSPISIYFDNWHDIYHLLMQDNPNKYSITIKYKQNESRSN